MTQFENVLETILEEYARRDSEGEFDTWEETDAFVKEKAEVLLAYVKEEPVSDALEKACEQLAENARKRKAETSSPFFSQTDYRQGIIDGAKWKKKQMMAKAIDGDVTFDYYGDDDKTYGCIAHDSFCLEDFGLKDFDKVKMILIKED